MDDIALPELASFLASHSKTSAPGHNQLSYRLLSHAPLPTLATLAFTLNTCIRLSSMPTILKTSHIYPIPKAGKTATITNLRPITLLEAGYKIITGTITNRITTLALTAPHHLIHPLQLGGTKNRSCQDALLALTSIIEDSALNKRDLHIAYADVQGAYDGVSPDSKTLSYRLAGFPESFIDLARNLDTNSPTDVILPGKGITSQFQPECGLKQGDGLSVLGWLLFINPLISWITRGLAPSHGNVTYTPDVLQATLNGAHLRRDHNPIPGQTVHHLV